MEKFFCFKCQEDVVLKDGKCPKCGTDWASEMEEAENGESVLESDSFTYTSGKKKKIEEADEEDVEKDLDDLIDEDITNEKIADTINFYLRWTRNIIVFYIILIIIVIIYSLVKLEETNGLSILYVLVVFLLSGRINIFVNDIRWKAYMLYSNYKKDQDKRK